MEKNKIRIKTPAKVNFFLNLQKKREDGYHTLLMDLIPISLYDTIDFKKKEDKGVQLSCNWDLGEVSNNLVVRAIQVLEQETGQSFHLDINLTKSVPHGAGLGGGSSNAAGTLVALNEWYQLKLSVERLRELGKSLGADVPFFITPVPSKASGIGEILSPILNFPEIYLVLIFPNFSISTREAYQNCRITGEKEIPAVYDTSRFEGYSPDENDFWEGLSIKYPTLKMCHKALLSYNAVSAGMSGSGSCLFGVFFCEKERDEAVVKLKQQTEWSIFSCSTLSQHTFTDTVLKK